MTNIMKYIYEIYKCGSFSEAASQLFISQPALSMSVKKEEEIWGTTFFDRNSHPIQLTPSGKLYIRKVEEIMLLEKDLQKEISDVKNLETGDLYIAGTQYTNSLIIPPVLAEFMQIHPQIRIHMTESSPEQNLALLRSGHISMCLNSGSFDPTIYRAVPIFRDIILIVVPSSFSADQALREDAITFDEICSGHIPDHKRKIPLSAFRDIPIILLRENTNLHEIAVNAYHRAGIEPHVIMTVEQSTTAYFLARAGIGASWVSNRIISSFPATDMRFYQIDDPSITRCYSAVTAVRRYVDHPCREFIFYLKEHYSSSLC